MAFQKIFLDKAKSDNTTIYLPSDNISADKFAPDAESRIVDSYNIPDGWMDCKDIGPKTIGTIFVHH
ncbi:MAG: phosphoglycerate kinase [Saprospiraceae bacterium]|nr:phosphoglycerate kinase [Saprospiraceae bacterium]